MLKGSLMLMLLGLMMPGRQPDDADDARANADHARAKAL